MAKESKFKIGNVVKFTFDKEERHFKIIEILKNELMLQPLGEQMLHFPFSCKKSLFEVVEDGN